MATAQIGEPGTYGFTYLRNMDYARLIAQKQAWVDAFVPSNAAQSAYEHNVSLVLDRLIRAKAYFEANPTAKSVIVRNRTPWAVAFTPTDSGQAQLGGAPVAVGFRQLDGTIQAAAAPAGSNRALLIGAAALAAFLLLRRS